MPLHHFNGDDIRHVGILGLGIKHLGEGFFHMGALFRDDAQNIRFLHLADHYDLQYDAAPRKYAWSDTDGLDQTLVQLAVNAFRQIWERHGRNSIPYSFLNDTRFTSNLELTSDGPGSGFTCATFVLRVLEYRGLRIIDESTWRERPGDDEWRKAIIKYLRDKHGAAAAKHIKRLEEAPNEFRIRPLDLVIAMQMEHAPSMDEIEARATEFLPGFAVV